MTSTNDSVKTIEAVVFDVGGVLVDWNPRRLYEQRIADLDELDFFLNEICTLEWNAQMDAGKPFHHGIAELQQNTGAEWHELIAAWWDDWRYMVGDAIAGTAELALAIRESGVAVYGLSNWSAETWPIMLQQHPHIAALFDGIVISGEVGLIKPDPRIYQLVTDQFELDPSTTLFIDDSAVNTGAADSLGWMTHTFTSAEQLAAVIDAAGLLAVDRGGSSE